METGSNRRSPRTVTWPSSTASELKEKPRRPRDPVFRGSGKDFWSFDPVDDVKAEVARVKEERLKEQESVKRPENSRPLRRWKRRGRTGRSGETAARIPVHRTGVSAWKRRAADGLSG